MREIKKQAEVPHTADKMYRLVNAIEDYPLFLPWCTATEVFHRDNDEIRASITVSGGGISKTFTTLNRLQENKMIEIRLIDGPFRHLEGFWRFESVGIDACRVDLDLAFEFAGGFLDMMFGPFFYQVAQSFVDAFAARADSVYGKR